MSGVNAAALAVDCVLFRLGDSALELLLLRREEEPYRGKFSLPGGALRLEETLVEAGRRLVEDRTGLMPGQLRQVRAFDALGRDPRTRVISFCLMGLLSPEEAGQPLRQAERSRWMPVEEARALAFDHGSMLQAALGMLRARVRHQALVLELLAPKFSLSQLQGAYEILTRSSLDKRNFRRRALASGLLRPLDEYEQGVAHRAARLYRVDPRKLKRVKGALSLL